MDDIKKQLKELNKVQKHWEDKIDKEIKEEDEVIHAIEETVSSLLIYQKANVSINGTRYMVKVNIVDTGKSTKDIKGNTIPLRMVMLVASNVTKATIAPKNYIPFTARCEYNYELTQKGNITTVVEGWIRHVTGLIKPEMLEE